MALAERSTTRIINPIDLVEQLAQNHDWPADRSSDDEMTLIVAGTWADYHVSLNWREDLEALHLACAFDFRVPSNRLPEERLKSSRVCSPSVITSSPAVT